MGKINTESGAKLWVHESEPTDAEPQFCGLNKTGAQRLLASIHWVLINIEQIKIEKTLYYKMRLTFFFEKPYRQ